MEPVAIPHRKSWIERRAAWVIGIGAILLFATFFAAIFFAVGTLFHDSDAFHMAVSTAAVNPLVMEKVGNPIETGRFVSGNMNVTASTGQAEFSIPVSGPKGHGNLYVEAHKTAGIWRLSVLEFIADGSHTAVDILPSSTPVSPK